MIRSQLLLGLGLGLGCGAARVKAGPPPCETLVVAARGKIGLEVVVRVNGAVCHREPAVDGTWFRERVTELCPLSPGQNRIEVTVERPRACGERVVGRRLSCDADEPD